MAAALLEFGYLFVVLALTGAAALRLGLSVIPLYVVGGVVAGPYVAGRLGLPYVADGEVIALLAELGIVLLLFFLGLEFSLDRLRASGSEIGRAGVVDLGVNLPLGIAIGLLLGWSFVESLLLGGIVYISSSAIVTKTLIDLGWIADPESEPILGTLVFEDLAIAVYLAVVTSLVLGGEGGFGAIGRSLAIAFGFLGLLFVAVQYGTGLFTRVLDIGNQEAFVLRALAVVIPVAGAALALGVSEAVAAFFVGMGFSASGHRERIERTLIPVRDVFAAIFFFWIGLGTDPMLLTAAAVPLALAVVLTTPAKVVSGYVGGRTYDLSASRSLRVGLGMVPRGEFSLVIAALAASGTTPVMREVIPAFAVGYVFVMSALGTVLMQQSDLVERLVFRGESDGVVKGGQ
ncbi:cation:proton antiporter [Haloferax mediterranei ATCC 33500]|uniref:Cation:proton antiporter n=1 Tax=Haloferax mediterranei (strain ATCC 33500 / DSM 1411 / JCM 8866 / NBRC 14739 / NCIMB 2177 / R-4) TaxID=523841 RepID=I3R0N5_HALMT|nr:cation:proton antiporter [Haloferax mediterranei]AFK17795.1 sodium/protn antiporter putative [Haloferax mediterranei ATCC 33500]AHZ22777.1 Na+/H+ antiporter-like protein yhaU [Haloferax mediterranei ATCC 33500]EMA02934.1 sodium/protn antiporter putative [Haloferax mediterranei ATCC 33500]MDX5987884.1 cation:proton antiporter [Haloferax mediterranei ATCC 33500]QCQ74358.1 cation:proton antiporter [Haloferax mediterranei ATCC 33500]